MQIALPALGALLALFVPLAPASTLQGVDAPPAAPTRQYGSSLLRHDGAVHFLAYTPDGGQLFSGGADGVIRVWDVETGVEVRRIEETRAPQDPRVLGRVARVDPRGERLALLSTAGELLVWRLETGALEVRQPRGGMDFAWSADGRLLLCVRGEAEGGAWTFAAPGAAEETGAETLSGVSSMALRSADVSGSGSLLAVGGVNDQKLMRRRETEDQDMSELQVLEAETGEPVFTRAFRDEVLTTCFFLGERRIAVGFADQGLRIFELEGGAETRLPGTGNTDGLALRNGAECLLLQPETAAGVPGSVATLEHWSLPAEGQPELLSARSVAGASGLAASAELVATSRGTRIEQARLTTGEPCPRAEGHSAPVRALATALEGSLLASASYDGSVRVWNTSTGEQEDVLTGHQGLVFGVDMLEDGAFLVSGAQDGIVRIWDRATGDVGLVDAGRGRAVTDVAFTPDGTGFATATADGALRLWDLETGVLQRELTGLRGSEFHLDFSPDGTTLAVGASEVVLLDWRTGTELRRIAGLKSPLQALAFAPDGRGLAGGFAHRAVLVWDARTGEVLQTFEAAHPGRLSALAWSSDGLRLASACQVDGTVQLWDVRSGTEVGRIETGSTPIFALHDLGDELLVGDQAGRITAWSWPAR